MIDFDSIKNQNLTLFTSRINFSLTNFDLTNRDIVTACRDADLYKFNSVTVNPNFLLSAKGALINSGTLVFATVGFPLGQSIKKVKVYETKNALKLGADGIEMVINIAELIARCRCVFDELWTIKKICHNHPLKVIIEAGVLTHDQLIFACKVASKARVNFVKSSSGLISREPNNNAVGINFEQINQLNTLLDGKCQLDVNLINDSNIDDFLKALNLGAAIISTSSPINICHDMINKTIELD